MFYVIFFWFLAEVIFFFFKQKTAYEISACLVGSEMCIRDRLTSVSTTSTMKMSNGASAAASAMLLCKFNPLACKRARSIGLTNPNWFFTAPVSVQMACVFSTGKEIFKSNDCGSVDKERVNPRSLRRFSKGLLLRLVNLTPRSSQTRFSG